MREWSVARLGYLLNSEDRVAFALDPHFDGAADEDRVREVFLGLEPDELGDDRPRARREWREGR